MFYVVTTSQPPAGFGLYVHWPFCLSKCPYCDFNSKASRDIDQKRWRNALVRELKQFGERTAGRRIDSIFFGGGTPSLMEPETVALLLETAGDFWSYSDAIEITLEANPGAAETERFAGLRSAGINRLSLGVQALNDGDLRFLGRQHSADEAVQAIARAQMLFPRFSFDLIYARPGQAPSLWRNELRRALEICGGHLSLYQLTVEEGTPFAVRHARGAFVLPDEEEARVLWDMTQEMTEKAGLPAYEISNHAVPGGESRHNLLYWQGGDYVGIGPGAHGRLTLDDRFIATNRPLSPSGWLERVEKGGNIAQDDVVLSLGERVEELMMMGLRLDAGIDASLFRRVCDRGIEDVVNMEKLFQLIGDGLVEWGTVLRLTSQGKPLLNTVLAHLLAD